MDDELNGVSVIVPMRKGFSLAELVSMKRYVGTVVWPSGR